MSDIQHDMSCASILGAGTMPCDCGAPLRAVEAERDKLKDSLASMLVERQKDAEAQRKLSGDRGRLLEAAKVILWDLNEYGCRTGALDMLQGAIYAATGEIPKGERYESLDERYAKAMDEKAAPLCKCGRTAAQHVKIVNGHTVSLFRHIFMAKEKG